MAANSSIKACLYKGAKVKAEANEEEGPSVTPKHGVATAAPTLAALSHGRVPEDPIRLNFSCDNSRYNKFNYKLKLTPKVMQDQWKIVKSQERINPAMFDKFVDDVINYTASDKTSNKCTIHEVDDHINEGGVDVVP